MINELFFPYLEYHPPALFYGNVLLKTTIIDISQEEQNWDINTDTVLTTIHIQYIDNPFTVTVPIQPPQAIENENLLLENVIILFDIGK